MKLRVSAVQYHLHTISSFEEFSKQVEHYIKTAEEFGSDFVLFPEFFTTQLMSIGNKQGQPLTIQDLPDFTERYRSLFINLAMQTKMHIIGEPMSFVKVIDCTTSLTYSIQMVGSQNSQNFISLQQK